MNNLKLTFSPNYTQLPATFLHQTGQLTGGGEEGGGVGGGGRGRGKEEENEGASELLTSIELELV
jgi:hypothetical protein